MILDCFGNIFNDYSMFFLIWSDMDLFLLEVMTDMRKGKLDKKSMTWGLSHNKYCRANIEF